MGASDSRSLRSGSYVRMQHFIRRSTYFSLRRFLGHVHRLSTPLHDIEVEIEIDIDFQQQIKLDRLFYNNHHLRSH
jgi:hypothetical protein